MLRSKLAQWVSNNPRETKPKEGRRLCPVRVKEMRGSTPPLQGLSFSRKKFEWNSKPCANAWSHESATETDVIFRTFLSTGSRNDDGFAAASPSHPLKEYLNWRIFNHMQAVSECTQDLRVLCLCVSFVWHPDEVAKSARSGKYDFSLSCLLPLHTQNWATDSSPNPKRLSGLSFFISFLAEGSLAGSFKDLVQSQRVSEATPMRAFGRARGTKFESVLQEESEAVLSALSMVMFTLCTWSLQKYLWISAFKCYACKIQRVLGMNECTLCWKFLHPHKSKALCWAQRMCVWGQWLCLWSRDTNPLCIMSYMKCEMFMDRISRVQIAIMCNRWKVSLWRACQVWEHVFSRMEVAASELRFTDSHASPFFAT